MDQFGRSERALEWRISQPAACQLTQRIVYERDELIAGAPVAPAPSVQENYDLGRGRIHPVVPGLGCARREYGVDTRAASMREPVRHAIPFPTRHDRGIVRAGHGDVR